MLVASHAPRSAPRGGLPLEVEAHRRLCHRRDTDEATDRPGADVRERDEEHEPERDSAEHREP
jgi:hypothetical protein